MNGRMRRASGQISTIRLKIEPLWKQKLTSATYDDLPKFHYREEPITAVVGRTTLALIVLFAAGVGIGAVGIHRLRRFPVAM